MNWRRKIPSDRWVAAALGVLHVAEVQVFHNLPVWVGLAAAVLVAVPFALRQWNSLAALVAFVAAYGLESFALRTANSFVPLLVLFVLTYSVAVRSRLAVAMFGAVLSCVPVVTFVIANPDRGFETLAPGDVVYVAIPWVAGRFVRSRQEGLRATAERDAEMRERDLSADLERARERERAHIARDVHDILAHTVSLMVVQAEAAEAWLERDPKRAAEAVRAIQEAGRQSLAELRSLLAVLRSDYSWRDLLAPRPSLQRIEELAMSFAPTGLEVSVAVDEGASDRMGTGLGLTIYRLVQEALTNALKHASATKASVALRQSDRFVEVVVADNGVGLGVGTSPDRGGYGLVGMRERVELYGGTLAVSNSEGGGCRVFARLPIAGSG